MKKREVEERCCTEMEKSEIEKPCCTRFRVYLEKTYPDSISRSCSGVIRKSFFNRIVLHLKGKVDEDKKFRWYVKKNGFKLMDVPELSLCDVLVVLMKEGKEVRFSSPPNIQIPSFCIT